MSFHRRLRNVLLGASTFGGLAIGGAAHATDYTWVGSSPAPAANNYGTASNWTPAGSPGATDTALFGASANTSISSATTNHVGGWTFNAGASAYTFTNNFPGFFSVLNFVGAGIVINGGSVSIVNYSNVLFSNASTAGSASIINNNTLEIADSATAGTASITNNGAIVFYTASTAGSASITNNSVIQFQQSSTGGNAAITNGASSSTDFSASGGPASDNKLSAGSIGGGGTFSLGRNELTIGSNNLSTNVTGVIADGGVGGGTGGSLVKTGTGTTILSGINTYTGATTVNGGALAVNGSILASSGVTVNGNGVLMGTGNVGNTLIAGGTFMPGDGTAGTSTAVSGTLGFNAASTYAVNINPTTASLANVSGTATLGGASLNVIFASSNNYISKQYVVLNAGGISGKFGTLVNTNKPAAITDSLSYDATHAYLNLVLNFQTPASDVLNGNQNNAANALINYFNTTGGIPLMFAMLSAGSLSQASGQPGASTSQSGITATGQFVNAVFDGAFDDNNGQGGAAGYAQADDEGNAYAAKPKHSRAARDAYAAVTPRDRVSPSFGSRWNVWAAAYGGNSRVNGDSSAGTSTTTSRIFGVAAGASYRVTPNTQLGFALGGAGSNFGLDGGFGGGRADIFNAAAYAKHNLGAAYLAGLLGYSWQDATTDRTVTIAGTDQLRASFKAQALAARFEGGWRYATPVIGITPYAAAQATSFYLPSYGETATSGSNTFALSYASKTVTATRGELGARFDKAMLVQGGVFTLKAKTAWAHDWNTDRAATATFQTLPGATFTVNGAAPSANAALVSLGGEMGWHNGWTLAANFDGEFSRTTAGYAGKGSVKYAW